MPCGGCTHRHYCSTCGSEGIVSRENGAYLIRQGTGVVQGALVIPLRIMNVFPCQVANYRYSLLRMLALHALYIYLLKCVDDLLMDHMNGVYMKGSLLLQSECYSCEGKSSISCIDNFSCVSLGAEVLFCYRKY